MLHDDDVQWRLAQLEYERLVAAMRASLRPAAAEQTRQHGRIGWRWSPGLRSGVNELTTYLRSEWARPFVKVRPMPHIGRNDRLTSVTR